MKRSGFLKTIAAAVVGSFMGNWGSENQYKSEDRRRIDDGYHTAKEDKAAIEAANFTLEAKQHTPGISCSNIVYISDRTAGDITKTGKVKKRRV